jgi:tetratricopeptide (TPR) repeat protein
LCLGESTTDGEYPRFLQEALDRKSRPGTFTVIDAGMAGTTTSRIVQALPGELETYRPDIVVAMMGINDVKGVVPYLQEKDRNILHRSRLYRLLVLFGRHTAGKKAEARARNLKTIEACEKELRTHPTWELYCTLGQLYISTGMFDKAEAMLKRAIELDPDGAFAYKQLVVLYQMTGKVDAALHTLHQLQRMRPHWFFVYSELGHAYIRTGEQAKAEQMFLQAQSALARETIDEYRYELSTGTTRQNYRALYAELRRRGVPLVCMQYPLQSVSPLKEMFAGEPGVYFVSNEENFARAVREGGYAGCFVDLFAGAFGHCSEAGNRLIAENLADTILHQVIPGRDNEQKP